MKLMNHVSCIIVMSCIIATDFLFTMNPPTVVTPETTAPVASKPVDQPTQSQPGEKTVEKQPVIVNPAQNPSGVTVVNQPNVPSNTPAPSGEATKSVQIPPASVKGPEESLSPANSNAAPAINSTQPVVIPGQTIPPTPIAPPAPVVTTKEEPAPATNPSVVAPVNSPQTIQPGVPAPVPTSQEVIKKPEEHPAVTPGQSIVPNQLPPSVPMQEPVKKPEEHPSTSSAPQGEKSTQTPQPQKQEEANKGTDALKQELLDTLEQEGGNWLLKRKALEQTIDVIEKINILFTQIFDSRMDFLNKRNKIDRDFDNFAHTIGFEVGDLEELLQNLLESMEHELKKGGPVTQEEQALVEVLKKKNKDIEELKANIKTIMDLDASIDDVIMKIEEQIKVCQNYQMQSWNNFQTIKKILSDEKAEELYANTEGLLKDMQEIYTTYLKGELTRYFDDITQKLNETMSKVKQDVEVLKAKGIDLKHEAEKLIEKEQEAEKKQFSVQEEQAIAQAVEHEKEACKKPEPVPVKSIWQTISDYSMSVVNSIVSVVKNVGNYLLSFFVSSKKTVPQKKVEEPALVHSQQPVEVAHPNVENKPHETIAPQPVVPHESLPLTAPTNPNVKELGI